jgi:2-keto-4-pentenoate hydratase/2-oxohepta-3-ene-1,7-dioic acid hydratase in catechol pathway
MRIGTLRGNAVLLSESKALDIAAASRGEFPADMLGLLGRWDVLRRWAATAGWEEAVDYSPGELDAPVPHPRQVFAIALNYRPHAAEAGFVPPEVPLVFTKFPTSITGPDAAIQLPEGNVDWEIEVVAVVGSGGHRISVDDAWAALAGVTCGQDLSERVLQRDDLLHTGARRSSVLGVRTTSRRSHLHRYAGGSRQSDDASSLPGCRSGAHQPRGRRPRDLPAFCVKENGD